MKHPLTQAFAALTLCAAFALPAICMAQQPARTSIYGTIMGMDRNNPNVLEVQTWHSGVGRIDVVLNGARINYDGQRVARGTFAGFFGYFTPGRQAFRAEEVTLSSSPDTYPVQSRSVLSQLVGVIQTVQPGRILVLTQTNGRVWVNTPERGLRTGTRVQVWGSYNAWNGTMTSRHISVL